METFVEATVHLRGGPFDGRTQLARFARDKPMIAMVTIDSEVVGEPEDLTTRPPISRHVYVISSADEWVLHEPDGQREEVLSFDYRGPMANGAGRLN